MKLLENAMMQNPNWGLAGKSVYPVATKNPYNPAVVSPRPVATKNQFNPAQVSPRPVATKDPWTRRNMSNFRLNVPKQAYDSMWGNLGKNVQSELINYSKNPKYGSYLKDVALGNKSAWGAPQELKDSLSQQAKQYLWDSNQMGAGRPGRVDPYGNNPRVVPGKTYQYAPPTIVQAGPISSRFRGGSRFGQ